MENGNIKHSQKLNFSLQISLSNRLLSYYIDLLPLQVKTVTQKKLNWILVPNGVLLKAFLNRKTRPCGRRFFFLEGRL